MSGMWARDSRSHKRVTSIDVAPHEIRVDDVIVAKVTTTSSTNSFNKVIQPLGKCIVTKIENGWLYMTRPNGNDIAMMTTAKDMFTKEIS